LPSSCCLDELPESGEAPNHRRRDQGLLDGTPACDTTVAQRPHVRSMKSASPQPTRRSRCRIDRT
jgi:hypothetical protein